MTPCPLCNHFRQGIARAIICREYAEIQRLEDEQYKHRQTCEVYNSLWYRNLWQGVNVIVINTLPNE